jgi:hypothetical protein
MLKSGDRLQKLLTLLITWAVLLALFFAYEEYFVKGQREYLRERGFRVLAVLSNELNAKVRQAQSTTKSFSRLLAPPTAEGSGQPVRGDQPGATSAPGRPVDPRIKYLEVYLSVAQIADKSFKVAEGCRKEGDTVPLELAPDPDNPNTLVLSAICLAHKEDPGAPASSHKAPQLYTVDLQPWIQDSFTQLGGFFDDVLVADSTGTVRFQKSRNGPRIADLHGLLPKSKPKKTTQKEPPGENAPASNDPDASEESGLKTLQKASTSVAVTLAGESYELFAQPLSRVLSGARPGAASLDLMVCGLLRTETLESESHSVPYSTLIWLGLLAAMFFSLSWPLFKLRLMSNTERFSPRDGWYLILAIFLASISAILMILNASYTARVQAATDKDMKRLADAISRNVNDEVSLAFQQLKQLPTDPEVSGDFRAFFESKRPQFVPSYLNRERQNQCYRFFKNAFWIDQNGQQQIKVDVQQVLTPMINVGSLSYFKNSVSDRNWLHTEGDAPPHQDEQVPSPPSSCLPLGPEALLSAHLRAEPRFSVNTGEFHLLLAAPVGAGNEHQDKEISVQAMTTEPLSLVNPILPPGYGFAVVDDKCLVLFHSQSVRNLKENFCEESKDHTELMPWLRSGSDTWLDISYTGRRERAYLRPLSLPGFSTAFLVVFQEPEREVTLNLAIILVCSILLGSYFVIPLLVALLHLSLRGPLRWVYPPQVIWPYKENALRYVELFAANGSMSFLFWLSYRRLHEAPLLFLTLAVPCLSVLFVLLKLRASSRVLHRFGATQSSVASAAILALLAWWALRRPPEPPLEWLIMFASFGAIGQIAVLLSGEPSWIRKRIVRGFRVPTRLQEAIPKQFGLAYALLALGVTACVAVVPCVGFFKYAYDAITELSLKHDQLSVSRSLVERRDSIRRYYEQLKVPNSQESNAAKTAKDRLVHRLGRYDKLRDEKQKPLLEVECEPTLTFEDQTAACKSAGKPEREHVTDRINDWIERQISRATLRFPSNQLGSEIGKLGVASTVDEGSSEEHYWIEENASKFSLHWGPSSIGSKLTVTSSYAEWKGLSLLGWVCLVLLSLLLILWLLSIVRRIFFIDLQSASPLDLFDGERIEEIQKNLLIIGPPKSGDRLRAMANMKKVDWRDMRVELDALIRDPKHRLSDCRGQVLVLEHVEFNLNDRAYNLARLNLLESLLCDSSHKTVIVSTIDLLYFLTDSAPEVLSDKKDPEEARRLLGRWAETLSKFTRLQMKDTGKEDFVRRVAEFALENDRCAQFAIWVCKECSRTEFLRDIGTQILEKLKKQPETLGWLVGTVLDWADTYYRVLWSSLTATERLVLYQLALDGWANPKNAAALQQLERKLLIYKAPMYRVMNESFRRFIKSPEHADEIANWERHEQQSTWRALRLFLAVIAIGAGIWLLYAQAELFQVGVGYIVAIGTLLTAVTGLLGRSKPAAAPAELSAPQQST